MGEFYSNNFLETQKLYVLILKTAIYLNSIALMENNGVIMFLSDIGGYFLLRETRVWFFEPRIKYRAMIPIYMTSSSRQPLNHYNTKINTTFSTQHTP